MSQDKEFIWQDGAKEEKQRKGFVQARRQDSRGSGNCVWLGVTGKGVGERKARAQVTLNKIVITSDFHLIRISQGLDGN